MLQTVPETPRSVQMAKSDTSNAQLRGKQLLLSYYAGVTSECRENAFEENK